jgi:hypothetical protein
MPGEGLQGRKAAAAAAARLAAAGGSGAVERQAQVQWSGRPAAAWPRWRMSSPSWSEWSSSAMGSFVTSAHAFLHACSSCARPSHRRVCVRVCACVCVCVCVCACPAPWAASSPPPTRSCTPAAPAPVRVTAVCVCACVCVQRHGQLRHLRPRLLARLQLLRPSESPPWCVRVCVSSAMGSFVTSAHAFLHACSSCARPSQGLSPHTPCSAATLRP